MSNILVIGAGSWGTALALALARNKHRVSLWSHNLDHLALLTKERCNNRYLPGIKFPDNLTPVTDLHATLMHVTYVLIVVPSHAFKSILIQLSEHGISEKHQLLWGTKGLDQHSNNLLSSLIVDLFDNKINHGIITGPSFSKEVAANLPTAMTVSANSDKYSSEIATLFHNDTMRVYTNPDLIGVQIGGAVKNVMAIAAGISDGLGFGANARSAIITRGLAEITRLGIKMGAHKDTFVGLAGLGDLVLTCTDNQSRNRQFGLALGKGSSIESARTNIGQEVEGYFTAKEIYKLSTKMGVNMPISEQVYNVIYNNAAPESAVSRLLKRNRITE